MWNSYLTSKSRAVGSSIFNIRAKHNCLATALARGALSRVVPVSRSLLAVLVSGSLLVRGWSVVGFHKPILLNVVASVVVWGRLTFSISFHKSVLYSVLVSLIFVHSHLTSSIYFLFLFFFPFLYFIIYFKLWTILNSWFFVSIYLLYVLLCSSSFSFFPCLFTCFKFLSCFHSVICSL